MDIEKKKRDHHDKSQEEIEDFTDEANEKIQENNENAEK